MTDSSSERQPPAETQRAEVPDTLRAVEGFRALGFFPADHAVVESSKLYVHGGYWTILRFRSFPATLSTCALAGVIQVPFHEHHADHVFEMGVEDAEREPLGTKIEGGFRVAAGIDSRYGESGVIPIAVVINGLSFDRPGDYSFFLKVDAKELARYHFRVMQVAQAGPVGTPPAEG